MKFTKLRNTTAKLRLSSHKLLIEFIINRNDGKCLACNFNKIKDEFHSILICPIYISLRKQLIKKTFI